MELIQVLRISIRWMVFEKLHELADLLSSPGELARFLNLFEYNSAEYIEFLDCLSNCENYSSKMNAAASFSYHYWNVVNKIYENDNAKSVNETKVIQIPTRMIESTILPNLSTNIDVLYISSI